MCLCPQTAFIESFLSGPTILIMNKDFYKIRDQFEKIQEELFKMNILFYDGKSALEHINKIWDDPQKWWNEKIFNVRKKFENLVCKTSNKEEALKNGHLFLRNCYNLYKFGFIQKLSSLKKSGRLIINF